MVTLSSTITMINSILPVLEPLVTQIETMTRSSPETSAKVSKAMADIKQALAALQASDDVAASQSTIARIEADAQSILQTAAGMQLPPPYNTAVMIAGIVVPSIFMAVNMAMTQIHAKPAGS